MYGIDTMINQTNFSDSNGIFQDSSNSYNKRYNLSIDIKILIPCIIIELLFEYTSHGGIISINNNKFNVCGTMFGVLYLAQIFYDNDSSFNSSIAFRSIVSVLCNINIPNFISQSSKLYDNITHSNNFALIVSITINLFKTIKISNTNLDNSYLLITVQYVTLLRNSYNINFNSISNCFIGDNNNNTSTCYFNNDDKNDITRLHPYYNNGEFVEDSNSLIYTCIKSHKCSNYQNVLFLRLIITINMVIQYNSGDSSKYVVNSHESYVLNNISLLNLNDEIASMYLDLDYFINELIGYNRGLFTVKIYIQYGNIETNIFQLLLHSFSVNKSNINCDKVAESNTCKTLLCERNIDLNTWTSNDKILLNQDTSKDNIDWNQVETILSSNIIDNLYYVLSSEIFGALIELKFVESSMNKHYHGDHNRNNINR